MDNTTPNEQLPIEFKQLLTTFFDKVSFTDVFDTLVRMSTAYKHHNPAVKEQDNFTAATLIKLVSDLERAIDKIK